MQEAGKAGEDWMERMKQEEQEEGSRAVSSA
jgi:hypothetical protein